MRFLSVTAKFKGMRKPQDFTVYPFNAEEKDRMIQSSTRIARVNLETGRMLISKPRSSGAYGVHLNEALGAKWMDCPVETLDELKAMNETGKVVTLID